MKSDTQVTTHVLSRKMVRPKRDKLECFCPSRSFLFESLRWRSKLWTTFVLSLSCRCLALVWKHHYSGSAPVYIPSFLPSFLTLSLLSPSGEGGRSERLPADRHVYLQHCYPQCPRGGAGVRAGGEYSLGGSTSQLLSNHCNIHDWNNHIYSEGRRLFVLT